MSFVSKMLYRPLKNNMNGTGIIIRLRWSINVFAILSDGISPTALQFVSIHEPRVIANTEKCNIECSFCLKLCVIIEYTNIIMPVI